MRILLVEDDKKIAGALSKSLRAESYAVAVAGDGMHGEEMASVSDYDVIILDVMLPRQDGWQTCRNLRGSGVLTPILMLTALDEVNDKIKGLDTGADDYLTNSRSRFTLESWWRGCGRSCAATVRRRPRSRRFTG
jgi:DNA-binding response OmpR family regulator